MMKDEKMLHLHKLKWLVFGEYIQCVGPSLFCASPTPGRMCLVPVNGGGSAFTVTFKYSCVCFF